MAGTLAVALGVLGLILPGLPGVVFFIVAAGCFARSSPRLEAWLLAHPHVGPSIRAWRATGAVPRRAKWLAALSMALSLSAIATIAPPVAVLCSGGGMAAALIYLFTRPDA